MIELAKGNIKFRAVELTDVDILLRWENDTKTWHLSNTLIPFSRFDIEQYVMEANKDIFAARQLRLMIESDQMTIGCVDLFDYSPMHRRAGIGILIDADYREQGFASSTLDLMREYASKTLNLHQLYCNIEEDNKASFKLFKKKGYKETGIKEDWNYKEGKWINEYLLQLILNH